VPDEAVPDEAVPNKRYTGDGTRRALLAAERTWLAWWRTGLAVAAVALAVGRLLPDVGSGASWPPRLLGIGYALLALVVFVIGGVRQRDTTAAMSRGSFAPLSRTVVIALTSFSIVLVVGTLAIIVATP
jgi:putative membrane protein